MARTITEITEEIKRNYMNDVNLSQKYGYEIGDDFDSFFNPFSIERLRIYAFAAAIATLENIFDFFRRDVDRVVSKERYGYPAWYELKARAFQFGDTLPDESDVYATIDDDDAKRVVKAAWCGEQVSTGIVLKVANIVGGNFEKLTTNQLTAFKSYISRIKVAGVPILLVSADADKLAYHIDIYYNPQVLNADGNLIAGGENTVNGAIENYLQSLDFNGEFVTMKFTDAIQQAVGVDIVEVKQVKAKRVGYDFTAIDARRIPNSGFYAIDEKECVVNYIPNV